MEQVERLEVRNVWNRIADFERFERSATGSEALHAKACPLGAKAEIRGDRNRTGQTRFIDRS